MTLSQATEGIFFQLTHLLEQLKDEQYSAPLEILNGNSIGKHIRHIVEFYECLEGCDFINVNSLDYDLRKRNPIYETNTESVITVLAHLILNIKRIDNSERLVALNFRTCPEENTKMVIMSTIERELAYNLEHSIHHMAIIRIAISIYYKEIHLEETFGISPSTLNYMNSIKEEVT